MEKLRTDYADAVFQGLRKYRKIDNSDGTVSFRDVTDYMAEGSFFGAEDINATNEAVNATQKKDSVYGVVYEELFLARVYVLRLLNNALLLTGTSKLGEGLNVSCKVSTYGDISQEETIRISWCSGEGSVTCVNGEGTSLGQITVICMYKNGMYCINVMEVLKQAATFAFNRIEFKSKSAGAYIFEEKIDDAYGVVGNLMKQIGATPLGFGDGTLTGAINELNEVTRIKKINKSVTTNGYGISPIELPVGNIAVVSAYSRDEAADIIMPFAVGSVWWIKAIGWGTNNPVSNKTINITCLYFNM